MTKLEKFIDYVNSHGWEEFNREDKEILGYIDFHYLHYTPYYLRIWYHLDDLDKLNSAHLIMNTSGDFWYRSLDIKDAQTDKYILTFFIELVDKFF